MAGLLSQIFGSAPKAAEAPTNNQQQQSTESNNQSATNNQQPQQNTGEPETKAPLDGFKDIWNNENKSGENSDTSLFGNVDPGKVFEATKSANFASLIPAEHMTAIQEGGEGAVKALQASLNIVSQAALAQSTLAATKIAEQGINKAMAALEAKIPGMLKGSLASDALLQENPALNSAAAKPIINALQAQLAVKFPDASASDLTKMAKDFLTEFASAAGGGTKQENNNSSNQPSGGKEIDWMDFVTKGLPQQ